MTTKRLLAAVSAIVVGLGVFLSGPAYADHEDPPTARELLELCDVSTDVCEFHPSGPRELFTEDSRIVGAETFNCTSGEQTKTVTWSDTTSQSNSVGLTLRTEAGFGKIFSIAYEQSYSHTWSTEHTESQSTSVTTAPGEVGWVERMPQMQRVEGTYEMHFGSPYKGHYIWYVPFTATGPVTDEPQDVITQNVRDMTEAELDACP